MRYDDETEADMLSTISAKKRDQKSFSIPPLHSDQGFLVNERGLSETEQLILRLANTTGSRKAKEMLMLHLGSGGKRIRVRLALAAMEALGDLPSRAIAWAAAVELLHNASLVHDDIQDGDRKRRGEPTLWARYGKAQAINAGDILLMLPFLAIAEIPAKASIRSQLSALLARRTVNTVNGQIEELEMLSQQRLSFVEYISMVRKKTGELLALPIEGAALISGKESEEARALATPFRELGTLFQFQDDILDLYGDKGRGQVGSDLYEGKVSALVVAHLLKHPEDNHWLIALLKQTREQTSTSEVDRAIETFREGGALDYIILYMQKIIEEVSKHPTLKEEPDLLKVAMELAHRAMKPIRHVLDERARIHKNNSSLSTYHSATGSGSSPEFYIVPG